MSSTEGTVAERKAVMRKKLVFSIAEFLQSVVEERPSGVDVEGLEVCIQCLTSAFGVDTTDEAQREALAVEAGLEQVFRTGLALGAGSTPLGNLVQQVFQSVKSEEEKKDSATPEAEPLPTAVVQEAEEEEFERQCKAYLTTLEAKGYFANTTPGDGEYEVRAEKARAKLKERVEAEKERRKAEAEELKKEGNKKLSQKDFAGAIADYTAAIERDPTNAVFYANRAAAHTHLRDHDAAVADCKAALARDPSYTKGYSRLGLALFSQQKYGEAIAAYEKALSLDPSNAAMQDSLKLAKKKFEAQTAAAGHSHGTAGAATAAGGHSHGPGASGHSHGPGAGAMPDFSSLLNNPAMMNLMNQFGGMGGAGGGAPGAAAPTAAAGGAPAPAAAAAAAAAGGAPGGMPQLGDLLNNPQMMGMAEQLLSNPAVGGLLNNPAIMNMATSMMQNPEMLGSVLSGLGGAGGAPGAGSAPGAGAPPQNQ